MDHLPRAQKYLKMQMLEVLKESSMIFGETPCENDPSFF